MLPCLVFALFLAARGSAQSVLSELYAFNSSASVVPSSSTDRSPAISNSAVWGQCILRIDKRKRLFHVGLVSQRERDVDVFRQLSSTYRWNLQLYANSGQDPTQPDVLTQVSSAPAGSCVSLSFYAFAVAYQDTPVLSHGFNVTFGPTTLNLAGCVTGVFRKFNYNLPSIGADVLQFSSYNPYSSYIQNVVATINGGPCPAPTAIICQSDFTFGPTTFNLTSCLPGNVFHRFSYNLPSLGSDVVQFSSSNANLKNFVATVNDGGSCSAPQGQCILRINQRGFRNQTTTDKTYDNTPLRWTGVGGSATTWITYDSSQFSGNELQARAYDTNHPDVLSQVSSAPAGSCVSVSFYAFFLAYSDDPDPSHGFNVTFGPTTLNLTPCVKKTFQKFSYNLPSLGADVLQFSTYSSYGTYLQNVVAIVNDGPCPVPSSSVICQYDESSKGISVITNELTTESYDINHPDVLSQVSSAPAGSCVSISFYVVGYYYGKGPPTLPPYTFNFTFGPTTLDLAPCLTGNKFQRFSYDLPSLGSDVVQFSSWNGNLKNLIATVSDGGSCAAPEANNICQFYG
ncbi:hypothetical protein RQP46_008231 [Phenoliferia psychrophenolica]